MFGAPKVGVAVRLEKLGRGARVWSISPRTPCSRGSSLLSFYPRRLPSLREEQQVR